MVPLFVQLIGELGKAGLKVMNELDDPRIDKRFVKNAIKVTEILNSISIPDTLDHNHEPKLKGR